MKIIETNTNQTIISLIFFCAAIPSVLLGSFSIPYISTYNTVTFSFSLIALITLLFCMRAKLLPLHVFILSFVFPIFLLQIYVTQHYLLLAALVPLYILFRFFRKITVYLFVGTFFLILASLFITPEIYKDVSVITLTVVMSAFGLTSFGLIYIFFTMFFTHAEQKNMAASSIIFAFAAAWHLTYLQTKDESFLILIPFICTLLIIYGYYEYCLKTISPKKMTVSDICAQIGVFFLQAWTYTSTVICTHCANEMTSKAQEELDTALKKAEQQSQNHTE